MPKSYAFLHSSSVYQPPNSIPDALGSTGLGSFLPSSTFTGAITVPCPIILKSTVKTVALSLSQPAYITVFLVMGVSKS